MIVYPYSPSLYETRVRKNPKNEESEEHTHNGNLSVDLEELHMTIPSLLLKSQWCILIFGNVPMPLEILLFSHFDQFFLHPLTNIIIRSTLKWHNSLCKIIKAQSDV